MSAEKPKPVTPIVDDLDPWYRRAGVVLLPDAPERAATALAGLRQPFAVSEARTALGSSRRVTVPLLELLDRRGRTRRGPDDRRVVRTTPPT